MDIDGGNTAIVTIKIIEEIAGVIPNDIVERLLKAMQPPKRGAAYEGVAKVVTDMVADGWSATQVVAQVHS